MAHLEPAEEVKVGVPGWGGREKSIHKKKSQIFALFSDLSRFSECRGGWFLVETTLQHNDNYI